jgi:hypothetical protein
MLNLIAEDIFMGSRLWGLPHGLWVMWYEERRCGPEGTEENKYGYLLWEPSSLN